MFLVSGTGFAQETPAEPDRQTVEAPAEQPEDPAVTEQPEEQPVPVEDPVVGPVELELPEATTEDVADRTENIELSLDDLNPAVTDSAQETDAQDSDDEKGEEEGEDSDAKTPAGNWWESGYVTLAGFFLVIFVSAFFSHTLSKAWRMPEYNLRIFVLIFCLLGGVVSTSLGWKDMTLGIDLRGGTVLVYDVIPKAADQSDAAAESESGTSVESNVPDDPRSVKKPNQVVSDLEMELLISGLNRRINPGNVREIRIEKLGTNEQVRITIPKAEEAEVSRTERAISESGSLEFRILASSLYPDQDSKLITDAQNNPGSRVYENLGGTQNTVGYWVPVSQDERVQFEGNATIVTRTRGEQLEVLVKEDLYDVGGNDIRNIKKNYNPEDGQPVLTFDLKNESSNRFFGLTNDNKKDPTQPNRQRQLGIIMNGQLYSAPMLDKPLRDNCMITFARRESADSRKVLEAEVQHLADVMNAGALPADLSPQPVSKQVTGATLGEDTIQKGMSSILLSGAAILVFMLFYYRFAGLIACFAVVMNFFLIMTVMLALKAAFTLPGLAGLVLTLGMAVDANILIFERIREELSQGASLRMAIRNGFDKALSAIVDSNVTTLISAVILYAVGNEQIRGFAVTLFLGVSFSMFTAIYCCRTIFEVCERRKWITSLKMRRLFSRPNFDFMGKRTICLTSSCLMILVSVGAVGARLFATNDLLDIDFAGGVSVEAVFNEPMDIAEIREKLYRPLDDPSVSPVQLDEAALAAIEKETGLQALPNTHFLINMRLLSEYANDPTGNFAYLSNVLKEQFPDKIVYQTLRYELGEATPAEGESSPTVTATLHVEPVMNQMALESHLAAIMRDASSNGKIANDFNYVVSPGNAEQQEAPTAVQSETGGVRSHDWVVTLYTGRENGEAFLEYGKSVSQQPYFQTSTTVGGAVAKHSQQQAVQAIVGCLVCIIAYIWFRFHKAVFGFAAAVALVHDVVIALGMVALSKWLAPIFGFVGVYEFKIGLTEVAAFLTIIGYSLNDTIVVFDRIRETRGKLPHLSADLINKSINQTLSRTILTSISTLFVLLFLYVFGGLGIHTFAFALIVGILVGTYSSIFVASVLLYQFSSLQSDAKRKNIPGFGVLHKAK